MRRPKMPKRRQAKPFGVSYADFLKALDPIEIGLKSCHAELDRSRYASQKRQSQETIVTSTSGLGRVEDVYFEPTAQFNLVVRDRKARSAGLKINCTFEAHIHGRRPINRTHAERFAKSGLIHLAWPYFRQLVDDVTRRMSIAYVYLPVVNKGE
jgi:hypothetical protein